MAWRPFSLLFTILFPLFKPKASMPMNLKFKLPEMKQALHIGTRNPHRCSEQAGEELQTFEPIESGLERWDAEASSVDGDYEPRPRVVRKIGKEVSEDDKAELEFELSHRVVKLEALQRIASLGHLHQEMRPLVWKLLLGYLPTDRDSWKEELTESRARYTELKDEHILKPSEVSGMGDEMLDFNKQDLKSDADSPLTRREIFTKDHPLSTCAASIWHQYFKDAEITEQIDRDLQRTHPDIQFFSGDSLIGKKNQEAMRNILLLFAKLNPEIGYVQGMNEVLAPLYYVFVTDPDKQSSSNAEADSFGCFICLLGDSVDHFCQQLDNSSVGIHSTLSHLSELLKINDEELWNHLEVLKVNPEFYAFRWITLLLTQEFEFHSISRIWDSLLSNPLGIQEMLLRVCCAMLVCVRKELLSGDFMSNLKLLQHYPQIDLEHLLDVAQKLTPTSSSPSIMSLTNI